MKINILKASIISTILLLQGCGGDSDSVANSIESKKYIVILKQVPSGICESSLYRDELKKQGLEGVVTKETDSSTSCSTYGRENDEETCAEQYLSYDSSYDKNCVIGVDNINPDSISYRMTNEYGALSNIADQLSASFK